MICAVREIHLPKGSLLSAAGFVAFQVDNSLIGVPSLNFMGRPIGVMT